MAPEVVATIISAPLSVVAAALTAWGTSKAQERKIREELRTEFMAEQAVRVLLEHKDWELRSFRAIKRHVGGFEDNELRKLLIRAGALTFWQNRGAPGEKEMWGLRTRNEDRLHLDVREDAEHSEPSSVH